MHSFGGAWVIKTSAPAHSRNDGDLLQLLRDVLGSGTVKLQQSLDLYSGYTWSELHRNAG